MITADVGRALAKLLLIALVVGLVIGAGLTVACYELGGLCQ